MFCSETYPTARKAYKCYLCDGDIEIGEVHAKIVGTTDGDLWDMRNHLECEKHTAGWDHERWEYHDSFEFRREYLGEKK